MISTQFQTHLGAGVAGLKSKPVLEKMKNTTIDSQPKFSNSLLALKASTLAGSNIIFGQDADEDDDKHGEDAQAEANEEAAGSMEDYAESGNVGAADGSDEEED